MTLAIGILIGLVLSLFAWVGLLEWRMHTYQKALLRIIDAVQVLVETAKTHNDEIESLKMQSKATINAVNSNASDIQQIIIAINSLSNEVFNDEIMQPKQKITIQ